MAAADYGRPLGFVHAVVVLVFLGSVALFGERYFPAREAVLATQLTSAADPANPQCEPPDWAMAMGHAEMWKLHHNCK